MCGALINVFGISFRGYGSHGQKGIAGWQHRNRCGLSTQWHPAMALQRWDRAFLLVILSRLTNSFLLLLVRHLLLLVRHLFLIASCYY